MYIIRKQLKGNLKRKFRGMGDIRIISKILQVELKKLV